MEPKVAKCLLVSKVLVADGIMTENERIFLDRMMRRLGLDDGERRRVLDLEGWDQAEPVVARLSDDEKREFLATLVDASSADGRLSPLEMATVKRITAALGVD
ncbi:MAG: TerB family tellurite resistance protein [Labilithrix sp.]|nr:TerB family tellurite resistance protein [Labilithrix sp.]